MMVWLWNKLAPMFAVLIASRMDILAVAIVIAIFVFFIACMAKAVGMNVSMNVTVVFTTMFATIALILKGIGWLVKNTFKAIRGCYKGSYNLFHSAGMSEFAGRVAALGVTGILIVAII